MKTKQPAAPTPSKGKAYYAAQAARTAANKARNVEKARQAKILAEAKHAEARRLAASAQASWALKNWQLNFDADCKRKLAETLSLRDLVLQELRDADGNPLVNPKPGYTKAPRRYVNPFKTHHALPAQ